MMAKLLLFTLLIASIGLARASDGLVRLKELCENESQRIEDIESIVKLAAAANSDDLDETELPSDCLSRYRDPLNSLAEIVADNEAVCKYQAVTRLSKFHWKHVVARLSDKWAKKVKGVVTDLPDPLFAFFVDYTTKVSERCMDSMFWNLELASRDDNKEILDKLKGKLNWSMNVLRTILVPQDRVKRFDSYMLFWSTILNKVLRDGRMSVDKLDENKDNSFAILRAADPSQMWEMQDLCRNKVRPIYQDTIHSVMRLVDLGYVGRSLKDDRFKKNELIKDWYYITQVCELMLGINYLKDPDSHDGKFELLKEKPADFKKLIANQHEPRAKILSNHRTMAIKGPKSVVPSDELELKRQAANLKWRIKRRNNLTLRMYKNMALNHLFHPITTVKTLFSFNSGKSSLKNAIKNVASDDKAIERMIAESEREITKEIEEEEQDDAAPVDLDEDTDTSAGLDSHEAMSHESRGLSRRKRDDILSDPDGWVYAAGFASLGGLFTFFMIVGILYVIHGPFVLTGFHLTATG